MNKPLVSIIIPVYNGSNYLREAIDSALNQTYKNIEVIVVNDGSKDNTEEIAKSYGNKIRYFSKENGGVSTALNFGLQKMNGEYFSWLSHDDVYCPDKLEKQIKLLRTIKKDNVILFSDYLFINEFSQEIGDMRLDHELLLKKPEYALLRSSVNGNTLLIPREAFAKFGYFDEQLRCTQDYKKWFEMMQFYKFVHIPEVLVKYRIHSNQDTKINPKFIEEGNRLWIEMMDSLPIERKNKLESNEFNFYKEISLYLKETPFEKAFKHSLKKVSEVVSAEKKNTILISFISHSSDKSGAERALLDIIDAVKERGIACHVVIPGHGFMEDELKKRNIYYDILDLPWWANVEEVDLEDNQFLIWESSVELARVLSNMEPDIVFTNTSVICQGAMAAKILGIPHVWNISEFGREEHGIRYILEESERLKFMDNFSDKIFFVSDAIRKYYGNKISIEKTEIMPNFVTIKKDSFGEKYFTKQSAIKLAIIGNIIKGKGQKDAILAVNALVKEKKSVELALAGGVGSEKYFQELKEIIAENKLENSVHLVGFVENATSLIQQADVVLVCSTYEGFGRVAVEAMLNSKPVIGAKSGATVDVIEDNANGFLYEPGNFDDLAKKINFFLENRQKCLEMGKMAEEFIVKKFNKGHIIEILIDNLFQILKMKKEKKNTENVMSYMHDYVEATKKIRKQNELLLEELDFIKSSKFWKLRGIYVKIKSIFKK